MTATGVEALLAAAYHEDWTDDPQFICPHDERGKEPHCVMRANRILASPSGQALARLVEQGEAAVADRDAARSSLGNLILWLTRTHPEYVKEYDRYRLRCSLPGCEETRRHSHRGLAVALTDTGGTR